MTRLVPRPDGALEAPRPVEFPFMAPRLQGRISQDGKLEISLWGAGDLGALKLAPWTGRQAHAPNRLTWPGGGVWLARSRPAL
ncbi:MAG TPA: hypothetical protein VG939_22595, partial [Caulobacteraceae bacterium]|nr:hypothetical protein [Caulobacteraceae bacterium]